MVFYLPEDSFFSGSRFILIGVDSQQADAGSSCIGGD
jgi:hypothetical protein